MRTVMRRSWPWLMAVLAVVVAPGAARADDRDETSLRELLLTLMAKVDMLAHKLERLDGRVAALEARPAETSPTPTATSTPPPTPRAEPPLAVAAGPADAQPAAEPFPSATPPPSAAVGAGPEPTAREMPVAPLPPVLSARGGSGYIESIDKTFVRMDPVHVGTSSPEIDLSIGAVFSYAGKTVGGLPQSTSLDLISTWEGWNAYSDREVVLYVDTTRYALGEASFRQRTKPDGTTETTFTVPLPTPVLQVVLKATEVVGTLGQVEFGLPVGPIAEKLGLTAPATTGTAR